MPDQTPVTIDFISAQFDDLQAAVVKEETDVTTYVSGLKAQIATGVPVTQEQLDALSAKFTGLKSMVSDFDLTTTAPPAPPAPLPTV